MAAQPTRYELSIEGMSCGGCQAAVRSVLEAVDGVREVDVDLVTGRAAVGGFDVSRDALVEAVVEAGYKVDPR